MSTVRIISTRQKIRALNQEFDKIAKELTKLIKAAILKAKIARDSNLYKTALAEFTFTGPDLILVIWLEQHAIFVDQGRKPYPTRKVKFKGDFFNAILTWIQAKKLQLKFRDKKGRFMSNNQIAFLICNAINKNGIKARPFLDTIEDLTDQTFQNIIDTEFINIIFEDLDQNLSVE